MENTPLGRVGALPDLLGHCACRNRQTLRRGLECIVLLVVVAGRVADANLSSKAGIQTDHNISAEEKHPQMAGI